MASSTRPCAINKCEISSCAVCHCCQNDLCLDHLKEHKDQLNAKLVPLANHINTFFDALEHFTPTSLPSFQILEQWRVTAHQTVDRFYERMKFELFDLGKNKSLEKIRILRNSLEQLIRKQGATQENIKALTNDIRLIEQEINNFQNIQINVQPLVIDENIIKQVNSSNR
jgi:replication fork clamp-binding protein CrfC